MTTPPSSPPPHARSCRPAGLSALALAGLLAACGCSADALEPPEAEVATPGAFIAVEGWVTPSTLTLLRSLDSIDLEGGRVLFLTVYAPSPRTWDEAVVLAKGPEPAIDRVLDTAAEFALTGLPHRVVWFRTLTPAEEARVP